MKKGLVWFKNDLRLHDNEALTKAIRECDELIFCYAIEDSHFTKLDLGFRKCDVNRFRFLEESVVDLQDHLEKLGGHLLIGSDSATQLLPELIKKYDISDIYAEEEYASEELDLIKRIQKILPAVKFHFYWGKTLYHKDDIPFSIPQIPLTSKAYRIPAAKESEPRKAFKAPTKLKSVKNVKSTKFPSCKKLGFTKKEYDSAQPFLEGGETQALKRLQYYTFKSELLTGYRWTRNGSQGLDYSSKFSPYLALGCISAREIFDKVRDYENKIKKNQSTWWLVFELVWRDYFTFKGMKFGDKIFKTKGYKNKEIPFENNKKKFERWCEGRTGIPFVDAHMRQLNETGYMSNRGRVNCASYFVHDLKIDWTWGAAYFESKLIDYDGITSGKISLSLPVNGIDGYNYDNKELYLGSATGKALFHTTDFSDLKKIADLPQTNTYFLAATDAGLLYAKLLNVNLSDEYTFYFANRNSGVRAVNTGSLFVSSQDTFAFKNTFYSANALKNDTQIYGRELWRMDDQHTELLKDIYPGFLSFSGYTFPNNASPKGFFAFNGEMYFIADQANGRKLLKFNPDFTFTNGGQDNKWSSPSNWKAGATPMITDNSVIPSSYNVIVDGTAYTKDFQLSSPVNLTNGILNVSGNVALGSKIILSNSSLVLKGNTSKVSGSDTSNYIVTNEYSKVVIENMDVSRGAVIIPVGTSNYYNPAIISNNGSSDSFSFAVSEGINNAADKSLNVTWDISESIPGGSNVTLNLGWNQSQEQAGFQRNTAKVGHYKNGQWTEENSGSVSGNNPYSISATGITTFSPFSIMNFATLGNSNFNKNKIRVFSNPTTNILNFNQEIEQIQILDISGKLLKVFNDTSKINILEFPVGTYIINYTDKNGNRNSEKIIKQ